MFMVITPLGLICIGKPYLFDSHVLCVTLHGLFYHYVLVTGLSLCTQARFLNLGGISLELGAGRVSPSSCDFQSCIYCGDSNQSSENKDPQLFCPNTEFYCYYYCLLFVPYRAQ